MKLFRQLSYASFVIGTIALSIPTISAQAATPDEQAVLAPVNAMFDGMAKRDAALIKEPLLRAAPWCSCETANHSDDL
jgi:hypothetical protein